jgi:hypothetical protein
MGVDGEQVTSVKYTAGGDVDLRDLLFQWVPVDEKAGKSFVGLDDMFYVKHPYSGQCEYTRNNRPAVPCDSRLRF